MIKINRNCDLYWKPCMVAFCMHHYHICRVSNTFWQVGCSDLLTYNLVSLQWHLYTATWRSNMTKVSCSEPQLVTAATYLQPNWKPCLYECLQSNFFAKNSSTHRLPIYSNKTTHIYICYVICAITWKHIIT